MSDNESSPRALARRIREKRLQDDDADLERFIHEETLRGARQLRKNSAIGVLKDLQDELASLPPGPDRQQIEAAIETQAALVKEIDTLPLDLGKEFVIDRADYRPSPPGASRTESRTAAVKPSSPGAAIARRSTSSSALGAAPELLDVRAALPKRRGGRNNGIIANGMKIRELRGEASLKQDALAKLSEPELSEDTIQNAEKGCPLSSDSFVRIACALSKALGRTIDPSSLKAEKPK
jgi:DNA-binding XRE family transcriptional regulator